MVECVTWATEGRFPAGDQGHGPITQQFNLRYQNSILMEEWTNIWVKLSEVTGSYEELDQYDTRASEFLVERDKSGRILGTIRTGPTTFPYMLKDHFAKTVGDGYQLPNSAQDHELSRMAVDRRIMDRAQTRAVTNKLLLAAQERGLQRGIKAYWGIVLEKLIDKVFERAGYTVEITGDAIIYPNTGEKIYGVRLPVNENVYRNCQEVSGIHEPVLSFGNNKNAKHNAILEHSSPMLSDDFFKSDVFEKETGRPSIHHNGKANGQQNEGLVHGG